ncbi:glycoside hydrolase superfamily [Earliella scabrosa]|nr:glycoside hydrolase superfamily [Earliella scabrosa]
MLLWRRYPSWALPALLTFCIVLLSSPLTILTGAAEPPRKTNGYTDVVTWDNYTLWVHDQRVFLHGGEFHSFRLPVPELWLDIFQKMSAAGLNHVSIYVHMGASNPSRDVVDFDDWRALKPIYEAASQTGLFLNVRPGPYINAETSAGGVSHWTTTEIAGTLRTNASDWTEAWKPYIDGIIKESEPYLVTHGGPIVAFQIDNEYSQSEIRGQYFELLKKQYRDGGIVVPLTYNDPNQRRAFINGTGAVDIYGLDAYPQGFDCRNPTTWRPVTTNYHQYHAEVNPSQPWYMPEYQGGAFDPWAGPGYDACAQLTGQEFEDVFYKHNYAANMKMVSYYMFYGGTNWGSFAFPGVYTSYDYGAVIRENRQLRYKYDEMKRQNIFIRSSPEFRKTDWVGESSTGIPGVTISNSAAYGTLLHNPDSGTNFLVIRQTDSTSTANTSFNVTIPTSKGAITIPKTTESIALHGRQSKIIITDYHFGDKGLLYYTTTSIFFAGRIGHRDVLFLYGHSDQSHEFAFSLAGVGIAPGLSSRVKMSGTANKGLTTVTVLPGTTGLVTVWESTSQLILYADPATAASFWAPIVRDPTPATRKGLENFWQFGTNTTVLVGGPYLVRNASISRGTLALHGDLNASVPLTVFAPLDVVAVSWNGKFVPTLGLGTGQLKGRLAASASVKSGLQLPELTGWKYKDSLPEIRADFDDAEWIVAEKTTTNINVKPRFGDGRVLYGCDYGYCEGSVFWRGHFDASGSETAANLTIYGGRFFAASVWLNDKFLGSVYSTTDNVNKLFTFPEGAVIAGQDNVLTVLHDNMGLDQESNQKSARGIAGFELVGGKFGDWKVQGKVGGYTNYPDKVRGLYNEGGLFGEREGWHLPGFDVSSWESRDLSDGLPDGGAGVGFFVTTFDLDIPKGTDTLVSFQYETTNTQPYRALLFVNGWQFGKRAANVGPQTRFPVPQGILNYNGKNTVAVALWALDNTPVSPSLQLSVDAVYDGGVGQIVSKSPSYSELRA